MKKRVIISTITLSLAFSIEAMTLQQWNKCRDNAEKSVNQIEDGTWAVEIAIKEKCGNPPASEPNKITGAIGIHPYDLVRSKEWKKKFKAVLKTQYNNFVDRLDVANETNLENNWVLGSGSAAHMGGIEMATFAIDSKNGKIFAAILESGDTFTTFGFNSWSEAPECLRKWKESLNDENQQ